MGKLSNKNIAILSESGFEESELFEPLNRLEPMCKSSLQKKEALRA